MSLSPEWRHRILSWKNELTRHFYIPLGEVEWEGFTTKQQLTYREALKGNFSPMPQGTRWGAKWEYGWFRSTITLPDEAAGKRIVLKVDVGGESAIYVNGKNAGAKDNEHHEVTLTMNGVPGQQYEILVEAYAGHGPRVASVGPTPPGRITVPEPGPTQAVVGKSTYGIWEEEVYQLWLDVQTLFEVRENLDPNSLRVAEIDAGLKDFTLIVDFELPYEEMMKTIRAGRERLKPLLECVNGSTAPIMFAFGHSHIDVAWLWPLAETERKCARTFATQLALMEEYPEYKFLQSQPHLYMMVKQRYPELYERIKEAVKRGQFIPEGGMWVEADTNISGGESLIRQFIHGKRFFKEEFGIDSQLCWLPDVFGYSAALPQIMKGCGIKYFSTQKIFWGAYTGGEPFPYNTFIWEGIDGSEILVHLHNDYNSHTNPATLIQRWNERVQKDGISTRLLPFGHGDGGGGPTRDHLEYLRRCKDLEGVPRTKICHPLEFFHDLEKRGFPENRYVGELYFQAHRGTYTSQARTKRGNRKSEIALREAEIWGATARALKGYAFPLQTVDQAWKTVLLNQFHDILPGSSIQRVYEEAEADYERVISTAKKIAEEAASSLLERASEKAITVFNSLSWNRTAIVPLPKEFKGAVLADGQPLPVQQSDDGLLAEVEVPSCGWITLYPGNGKAIESALKVTPHSMENEFLRIEFNDKGEIVSIFDKEADRELAAGPCNSFKMYKDVPSHWDAWDIDSMYSLTPVELNEPASFEVVSQGPLMAILRVKRKLHNSLMTQDIILRRNSRRVDFVTTIDWQESHKLLKVAFPVNIHTNEGVHEIQFGHLKRPNHKSRPFDADRFEVCNHKWTALMEENRGFAVLNDCKYGVNTLGNSINLTLLRAPLAPDMNADKGIQHFTYSFYAWNGSFAKSDVIREAYDLNCPVMVVNGAAEKSASLFSLDAANIILETVKVPEDGSNDIILRLYESKRTATRCTLSVAFPIAGAEQTDMLENTEKELVVRDNNIELDFRPFEIKTVRLKVSKAEQ
ncbi:alpha-mannosidase [Caldicoprobacter faecalis]|uniref:Alpha-mannosidase n=1 Tax=Caldicoprobacter faecalis TaxID=937334 RepID=A0A1I5Y205_9FIRM|nr:glycoside hydrolase family 38 C-terminal domain-containing protein [Caldicoprobacter faecalis]SFQ38196.1 alpha-mannosidase [Caldicoprobacter faecalis]